MSEWRVLLMASFAALLCRGLRHAEDCDTDEPEEAGQRAELQSGEIHCDTSSMDVVDLTDSPFGNAHETAAAAAVASRIETAAKETLLAGSHSAAEGGDTPSAEDGDANSSAASLRARPGR